MGRERIVAVRETQHTLVGLCRTLTPEEWAAPSRCEGWSVQDVLAHMAAIAHGVLTPWMVKFMTTKSVERTNDADVEVRRSWPPATSTCTATWRRPSAGSFPRRCPGPWP